MMQMWSKKGMTQTTLPARFSFLGDATLFIGGSWLYEVHTPTGGSNSQTCVTVSKVIMLLAKL